MSSFAIHFRDARRPPHEIQFELERKLRTLARPGRDVSSEAGHHEHFGSGGAFAAARHMSSFAIHFRDARRPPHEILFELERKLLTPPRPGRDVSSEAGHHQHFPVHGQPFKSVIAGCRGCHEAEMVEHLGRPGT